MPSKQFLDPQYNTSSVNSLSFEILHDLKKFIIFPPFILKYVLHSLEICQGIICCEPLHSSTCSCSTIYHYSCHLGLPRIFCCRRRRDQRPFKLRDHLSLVIFEHKSSFQSCNIIKKRSF
uniref:Paired amphipathic helix protein Sin3 n=1 Tax=Rhizophora mucronata TaxID=61149 RepID=A0A2P2MRA1_RHIMU